MHISGDPWNSLSRSLALSLSLCLSCLLDEKHRPFDAVDVDIQTASLSVAR